MIWNAKWHISLPNFQTSKLSRTSDQGSTSNGADLSPLWNKSVEEVSKRLWLPTGIDSVDLVSTSFHGSVKNQVLSSLSMPSRMCHPKTNLSTTYLQSFTCSLVDSMDVENTNEPSAKRVKSTKSQEKKELEKREREEKKMLKDIEYQNKKRSKKGLPPETESERAYRIEANKKKAEKSQETKRKRKEAREENNAEQVCHKYRLDLDRDQTKTVGLYMWAYRKTYNETISLISKYYRKYRKIPTQKFVRDCVLTSGKKKGSLVSRLVKRHPKLADISQKVRLEAIGEAFQNVSTNMSMVVGGLKKRFSMGMKRKCDDQTIVFPRIMVKSINSTGVLLTDQNFAVKNTSTQQFDDTASRLKFKKPTDYCYIPSGPVKVRRTDGIFEVVITFDMSIQNSMYSDTKELLVGSGDPGVRTFLTTFGIDGVIHEFGIDVANLERLQRRMRSLDKEIKVKDQNTCRKRYNLKQKRKQLSRRLQNRRRDFHKKVASYISQKYDVFLLPHFHTSEMQKSKKINSTTKRRMSLWAHYKFKQILRFSMFKRGKVLIECDESYTTKTCGRCGILHDGIGSSKRFRCPNCRLEIDRDFNGARNVLLRCIFAGDTRQPSN